MSDIQKATAQKKEKIPYAYDLSLEELTTLYVESKIDVIHALSMAYTFGFIRGTRAKGKKRVPIL